MDDKEYSWNSYERLWIDKPSKLQKQKVLDWFGGKQQFIQFHQQKQDLSAIKELIIENECVIF